MDPRKRSRIVAVSLVGALATVTVIGAMECRREAQQDECLRRSERTGETCETTSRGGFGISRYIFHCGGS